MLSPVFEGVLREEEILAVLNTVRELDTIGCSQQSHTRGYQILPQTEPSIILEGHPYSLQPKLLWLGGHRDAATESFTSYVKS